MIRGLYGGSFSSPEYLYNYEENNINIQLNFNIHRQGIGRADAQSSSYFYGKRKSIENLVIVNYLQWQIICFDNFHAFLTDNL